MISIHCYNSITVTESPLVRMHCHTIMTAALSDGSKPLHPLMADWKSPDVFTQLHEWEEAGFMFDMDKGPDPWPELSSLLCRQRFPEMEIAISSDHMLRKEEPSGELTITVRLTSHGSTVGHFSWIAWTMHHTATSSPKRLPLYLQASKTHNMHWELWGCTTTPGGA